MAEMLKLIGSEVALSTASNVGKASAVRVLNDSGSAVLITRANTGGTIGTCTLPNGATEVFQKEPNDTLASNAAVKAVSVAYN